MGYSKSTEGYEVGYGKPPKEHQFSAGHTKSKGKRKRKKPSFQAMVEQELMEPTPFVTNGKVHKLPAIQLLLRNTKLKSFKGDAPSTLLLMKLGQLYLPKDADEEGDEQTLTDDEIAIVNDVLAAKALFEGSGSDE